MQKKQNTENLCIDGSRISHYSMYKFIGGVMDNRTGMEVLLKNVSYNEACLYIDKELQKVYGGVQEVKNDYRKNRTIISTSERVFLYDEDRGLLLGD